MSNEGPEHFSPRIRRVLDSLTPYPGKSSVCHPKGLLGKDTRVREAEGPVPWLKRISGDTEDPDHLALLDNVAFTAEVAWVSVGDEHVIDKVHAQALVLQGATVEDVIYEDKEPERCQYLRADFDPKNLGRLFPDPIVHIHASLKHEPRFPAAVSNTVPHIDFIELVLRNYAKNVWESWADRVWERRVQHALGMAPDPRAAIRAAFREGQYQLLYGELKLAVKRWKDKLREEKRLMSSFTYDPRFEAISY